MKTMGMIKERNFCINSIQKRDAMGTIFGRG